MSASLDPALSRLIGEIYRGAHDRQVWNTAMDAVCERVGGRWMMVGIFDEQQRAPVQTGWHRLADSRFTDSVAEYIGEAYLLDPTNQFAARNPSGGIFRSTTIAQDGGYHDHAFVRWLQARFGSAFWQLRYSGSDGLSLGISLHTDADQGPLGEREETLLTLLQDHIQASVRLAARPTLLDGPEALILLDAQGRIIAASDAAARLIASADGLTIADGAPRATVRLSIAGLDRAIRAALSSRSTGSAGGSTALERRRGAPLCATVTPLPPGSAPFPALHAAALIRIVDPSAAPELPRSDWRALFGFTPAETRLAVALLAGDGNLRDTADQLGIAYATARNQLASLFGKAGVRSQSQLVRLLTRLG